MVKNLVTGGTGFVGSAIVRQLADGHESVVVLTRNPIFVDRRRRVPGVFYIKGDIFDSESLERAMSGCDAVINAAQFDNAPFENPRKGLTYERVDGEGTERQVAAAKKVGVKRFIYISGAGTREGRTEPWFRAKCRAEKAVKDSGMNWTIFRPSWIYGPGDRSLNRFATFARLSPIVPLIGSGEEKIPPVYVGDVAGIVGRALNDSRAYGKTFDIGGPEELTMKEIVRTLLKVQGKHRLIFPLPKPFIKWIAEFLQYLPGPPLTPDAVAFVTMQEKVDVQPLLAMFNFRLTPLNASLRRYLGTKESENNGVDQRVAASSERKQTANSLDFFTN